MSYYQNIKTGQIVEAPGRHCESLKLFTVKHRVKTSRKKKKELSNGTINN